MKFATSVRLFGAAAAMSLFLAPVAQADSGVFIGASIGESDLSDEVDLNDDDVAYKAMIGYIFDMPVVDFGLELDYVEFGGASENFGPGSSIDVDATAWAGYGIIGIDWGLDELGVAPVLSDKDRDAPLLADLKPDQLPPSDAGA